MKVSGFTGSGPMQEDYSVDVVGLGFVLIDHLVVLPQHPEVDSKTPVLADHLQVGGPVPTALAMLRRLERRCSFVGCWGDDAFGQMIDTDLQSEGIETRHSVRQPDLRTGFAHVWVCAATARRTVAYRRPTHPIAPRDLDRSLFASARMVHLDGWPQEASLAAAKMARESGCLVALDAGSPKPGVEELLRYVDVLNAPRHFLEQFLGEDDVQAGIRSLLHKGPAIVTVTSGARGAAIGTGEGILTRPAFAVDAVDTTGAGDVFTGALLHGVLQGWSPDRMLEFAMATAALKCTGIGNREALPELSSIERLMDSGIASQSASAVEAAPFQR